MAQPEELSEGEEIGAVGSVAVEVEMTGVEEVVVAAVMMRGADVAIVEEEVVVEAAETTVPKTKTGRDSSSRMSIEEEMMAVVLTLVPELQALLQACRKVAARQKLSFTTVRPTRKNSP